MVKFYGMVKSLEEFKNSCIPMHCMLQFIQLHGHVSESLNGENLAKTLSV